MNKMNGIETNLYRSGNNFWLQGQTDAQRVDNYGVALRKTLNPKVVVTPFVRINLERQQIKALKGYMSDGTAINASDPSSMKDQGITRNAMYHVDICDYDVRHSTSSSSLYKAFLTRDNAKNHGQYSFGGRSQMRSVLPKHKLHNEFLESTASSVPKEDYFVYRKDQLQRVSDYTKNISQSIFSPGLLHGERQTPTK